MLLTRTDVPPAFLDAHARDLKAILGGPTLFDLPGERSPALFVSVLLHGNETSGLTAVQKLLKKYAPGGGARPLPRALVLFVGNVAAAERGLRRFDDQPDYNRIWPGSPTSGTPEHRMMQEITEAMRRRGIFASVDIHNNTGRNPYYGCVNRLEHRFLRLASLFGRTIVYYLRPRGVQSMAFAQFAPSVTLECGQPDSPDSAARAHDYLDACLHVSDLPDRPMPLSDVDIFHTVATIRVPQNVDFAVAPGDADLVFRNDLDLLNFRELTPGTELATSRIGARGLPEVRNEAGEVVTRQFLSLDGTAIALRQSMMPSMFTTDTRIIRQDCVGYFMERLSADAIASAVQEGHKP